MPRTDRWALALAGLLTTFPLLADLPRHNPVPGGIAVIPIGGPEDSVPVVQFGAELLSTVLEDGTWHALVGLGPDALPGKYILTVRHEDGESTRRVFRVHPLSAHLRQRLVKLPDEFVNLPFDRYAGSKDEVPEQAEAAVSGQQDPVFQLNPIVNQGRYVPYGRLVRETDPDVLIDHPWITYITAPDEIVLAPAPGVVERIYLDQATGLTLVLRHGGGLVSVITRLGDTVVRPNEPVQRGQVMGTASSLVERGQGRVDWYVLLNNSAVDPLELAPSS